MHEAPSAATPVAPTRPARPPLPTAPWSSKEAMLSRAIWALLFLTPVAVVITAMILVPDHSDLGTHGQLGLPPCGFFVFTGYPCPGCGLTTAFAHMVRLELHGAWTANPFGIPLFLSTVAFIPFAALGFLRGWSVLDALDRVHAEKIAIALSLMSVITWVARVAIQMFG